MRRLLSTYFLCTEGGGRENLEDIYREITAADSAQRRIYNTRSTSMPDIFFHLFSLLARILFLRSWSENSSWALTRTLALSSLLPSLPVLLSTFPSLEKSRDRYTRIWISSGDRMRHPSAFTYDYAIRYHAREQAPSRRYIPYTLHTSRIPRSRATAQTCGSAQRRKRAAPRSLRDKTALKKRDIQIRSTVHSIGGKKRVKCSKREKIEAGEREGKKERIECFTKFTWVRTIESAIEAWKIREVKGN